MIKEIKPISNNGNVGLQELLNEVRELRKSNSKKAIRLKEACAFLGISKSQMYKLTSTGRIPFSKPTGKLMYFSKSNLSDWALSNQVNQIK